jgi:hypothetical protein
MLKQTRISCSAVLRLFAGLCGAVLASASLAAGGSAAQRSDARPLTATETGTFLPLLCRTYYTSSGVTHCLDRIGYTFASRPEDTLALTAIVYGSLTQPRAREAYVTYQSDWEPHATNYGGGILFEATRSGWRLVRWIPGGQMDRCLSLQETGRRRFLCWSAYAGMGVVSQTVRIVHVPPLPPGPVIISASDGRGSPFFCEQIRSSSDAEQPLKLAPPHRSHTGAFAEATLTFATSADIAEACDQNDVKRLRVRTRTVRFIAGGGTVTVQDESSGLR